MKETTKITPNTGTRLAVDTKELAALLCCGRATAVKIGVSAGARISIGRRVLWSIEKINEYLKEAATHEN